MCEQHATSICSSQGQDHCELGNPRAHLQEQDRCMTDTSGVCSESVRPPHPLYHTRSLCAEGLTPGAWACWAVPPLHGLRLSILRGQTGKESAAPVLLPLLPRAWVTSCQPVGGHPQPMEVRACPLFMGLDEGGVAVCSFPWGPAQCQGPAHRRRGQAARGPAVHRWGLAPQGLCPGCLHSHVVLFVWIFLCAQAFVSHRDHCRAHRIKFALYFLAVQWFQS